MKITDSIAEIKGVGEKTIPKLERLGITTIKDLLYHIPSRYLDFRNATSISRATINETVSITGQVTRITNAFTRKGKKITTATILDQTGTIQLVWFNQTFLTKTIHPGDTIHAAGQVTWWSKNKAIIAPFWQKSSDVETSGLASIIPIYPETDGVTSAWLRKTIATAWEIYREVIVDEINPKIRNKYDLPILKDTLEALHFPKDLETIEQAKYRLAFEEMFWLQKASRERRREWESQPAPFRSNIESHSEQIAMLMAQLPFDLTDAQKRVTDEVFADLAKKSPMNRLVQGDVGSGKTVVAALAAYATYLSGYPSFLMAPTEVLAHQHYQTFTKVLGELVPQIALVSGGSKTQNFENADIIIGTHALFHQREKLPEAGLVIIDEQHKFGVEQRAKLIYHDGHRTPHILAMTATPIPRSLALTIYGDQDISLIDELPPGRKPVKTWVVDEYKRADSHRWIHEQIKKTAEKTQALVVYPLIDDSEHESLADVKAATSEFKNLQNIFPDLHVELLHGRLKANEKNSIVEHFRDGKIDILISTSVVEVGIDAPNASIILIENAERFGLATLHQLRGRVGRRGQQAYCFLFAGTRDEITIQRLKAMEKHHNGLNLAEIDLELRGPGQVFGTRQHGVGELRFAKITDLKLIQQTRDAVQMI